MLPLPFLTFPTENTRKMTQPFNMTSSSVSKELRPHPFRQRRVIPSLTSTQRTHGASGQLPNAEDQLAANQ